MDNRLLLLLVFVLFVGLTYLSRWKIRNWKRKDDVWKLIPENDFFFFFAI